MNDLEQAYIQWRQANTAAQEARHARNVSQEERDRLSAFAEKALSEYTAIHNAMGDCHSTVTDLREKLKTPAEFTAWLEARRDVTFISPLAEYIGDALADENTHTVTSDSTHCYWWIDGHAYSLMLPEWARALHRQGTLLTSTRILEALHETV